ncbi:MAG: hypothetical protein N3B13_12865, partial [Deltaproteobacteria bacterium]|nr:hypothetical protein [Deltaproteobacteria bacterium]
GEDAVSDVTQDADVGADAVSDAESDALSDLTADTREDAADVFDDAAAADVQGVDGGVNQDAVSVDISQRPELIGRVMGGGCQCSVMDESDNRDDDSEFALLFVLLGMIVFAGRRGRRFLWLLIMLSALPLYAQTVNTNRLVSTVDSKGVVLTESGEIAESNNLNMGFYLFYVKSPLIFIDEKHNKVDDLVDYRLDADLFASYSFAPYFEGGLVLPMALFQSGKS